MHRFRHPRTGGALAAVLLALAGSPGGKASDPPATTDAPQPGLWIVPSAELPPPLNDDKAVSRVTAVAATDDGGWIAWAEDLEGGRGSTLTLLSPGPSPALELRSRDRIRALALVPPGPRVFAVLARARRRAAPDVYLAEVRGGRLRRALTLPASAADLQVEPGGARLLVACTGEIRTVLLPDVRSGPLFRLPGAHRALDVADEPDRVWVGGPGGIRLVDLSKPPGREDLPVLAEVGLAGKEVRDLAVSPDGGIALVLDTEGSLWEADLRALTARPLGRRARFVLWPMPKRPLASAGSGPPAPRGRPAPPARPPEASGSAAAAPSAGGGGRSGDAGGPAETAGPAAAEIPRETPRAPARAQPAPSPPEPTPAGASRETGQGEGSAEPDSGGGVRIRGRLSGPAASRVRSVVILGPDNILREFARVRPDENGVWEVRGLPEGRYRIVLDGGGDVVLISDPGVIQLEVKRDAPVIVPHIRVLRVVKR